MIFSPVRLHQDAVDLVDADDLLAISDGFEHGGDAEVAGTPEQALGRAYNEGDGVLTEGVMTHADGVALGIKEGLHVLRIQAGHFDGVGDAALDVLIDGQVQFLHELGLGEKDEVVVLGEVLE